MAAGHEIKRKSFLFWGFLAVLTAVCITVLTLIGLPAAALVGAIGAGVFVSAYGDIPLKVPPVIFLISQSLLGCMIARIFTPAVLESIADNGVLVIGSVLSVLACSFVLGALLTRSRVLPGSTAIWGSWPGAASVMAIMAEAYGADIRLVALMQYLRVVMVALAASVVSMCFGIAPESAGAAPSFWETFFPALDIFQLGLTVVLALACTAAASVTKFKPGPLLLSMAAGAVLNNMGVMTIQMPPWLLLLTYVVIGWSIGLRFTRQIIIYALHVLPKIFGSILTLLVLCGGIALLISVMTGIDPLTAYLAASPGGADSIAIIAASADVDMAFIMSVQIARFILILLVGPFAGRMLVSRCAPKEESTRELSS